MQAITLQHAANLFIFFDFMQVIGDLRVPCRFGLMHDQCMGCDWCGLLNIFHFELLVCDTLRISHKLGTVLELRREVERIQQEMHHVI